MYPPFISKPILLWEFSSPSSNDLSLTIFFITDLIIGRLKFYNIMGVVTIIIFKAPKQCKDIIVVDILLHTSSIVDSVIFQIDLEYFEPPPPPGYPYQLWHHESYHQIQPNLCLYVFYQKTYLFALR